MLEKTAAWIRRFKDVGDIAAQYDPAHASLPWAAVRFLLQVSINNIEIQAGIVEDLEMITRSLARFKEFEKIHLSITSSLSPKIEHALAELYATMLECLASHVRYFKESTGKRLLKVPFRPMDDDFHEKIRAKEDEVLKLATLDDTSRSLSMELNLIRLCDKALISEKEIEEAEFFELLAWLSPVPFMRDHETVKRNRLPNSGKWLLQHPAYVTWRSSSSSSILLLHGIRGCGKTNVCSVLVDTILDEKAQNPQAAPIAYFYCADVESERARRSPDDVFRSIVRQLTVSIHPQRSIHASIASSYERAKAKAKIEGSPSDVTKLRTQECLDLILESLDNNPATIVVDTLDEISADVRYSMLDSLNEIVNKSANVVKIFLTTRDDSTTFEMLKDARLLCISQGDNGADIENYTRWCVDTAVAERRLLKGDCSDILKDQIISNLVAGAGEMFMWVKMQLSCLCAFALEKDVRDALATVCSSTLDELYAATFNIIKGSGETAWKVALRFFSWLLYMQEPLSGPQLATLIGKVSGSESLTPGDLVRLCLDLLDFSDEKGHSGQLRFSHHSVQEFLRTQVELNPASGHSTLASDSLSICDIGLPFTTLPVTQQTPGRIPSDQYAAMYWLWHLQQADIGYTNDELYRQAVDFVFDESETSLTFMMWLDFMAGIVDSIPRDHRLKADLSASLNREGSPIFALSIFGMHTLVANCSWPTDFGWDQHNDSGHTALYLACCSGNEHLIKFLVSRGATVNIETGKHGSPLYAACFHGWASIVDFLLSRQADVHVGNVYESAFEAAFRGDSEETALALLKSGFQISTQAMYDSILAGATQAGVSNFI